MSNTIPEDGTLFNVGSVLGDDAPKYPMTFGKAERLGVFENYRFFTPALLYLYGRFTDAPLVQFLDEHPDARFLHYRFDRPLFTGLDTPDTDNEWNYVLWAIEVEHWEALDNWLLSVTMVDEPGMAVYRVGANDLVIMDPLVADKSPVLPPQLPTIEITYYGVNGSEVCCFIEASDIITPPRKKFSQPQGYMKAFAAALFSGGNPVQAAEEAKAEDELKEQANEDQNHPQPGE